MANDTPLTIIGNLTADPDLRFTPAGAAVANFTVASTPSKFDRQTNEYVDGETIFMRCTAWQKLAENVTESLTKGTRVVASGRLRSNTFETKDGEKRTALELEVDDIGPSLRRAVAQVTKNPTANRPPHTADQQQSPTWNAEHQGQGDSDPWAGNQTEAPF